MSAGGVRCTGRKGGAAKKRNWESQDYSRQAQIPVRPDGERGRNRRMHSMRWKGCDEFVWRRRGGCSRSRQGPGRSTLIRLSKKVIRTPILEQPAYHLQSTNSLVSDVCQSRPLPSSRPTRRGCTPGWGHQYQARRGIHHRQAVSINLRQAVHINQPPGTVNFPIEVMLVLYLYILTELFILFV